MSADQRGTGILPVHLSGSARAGSPCHEGLSRRNFLWQSGGLGAIALAWLLARDGRAAAPAAPASPWASSPARAPHFAARAKRVIQIFCAGGVSHVDTFDYKPDLAKHHGKPLEGKGENAGFFGQPGNVMQSPFT